jgi:UTP--glucose-1-phosphate uridylyltransferase
MKIKNNITKAVFPVAGLGTRFLPATKAIPKEMLPIIDKPLIEYAVEEAVLAGIEEIIFITSHTKRAIEDHFDQNFELEKKLLKSGKEQDIKKINRAVFENVKFTYVRQKSQRGLGDAVLHAEHLIQDEAFAIILADDLILNDPSCISQLISVFEDNSCSVIGLNEVPNQDTSKYGIISGYQLENKASTFIIDNIIEKPKTNPPSNLAVVGRYILSKSIFSFLHNLSPSIGGEVQLTDAIKLMLNHERVIGHLYQGTKFDCGSRRGYVDAIIHLSKEMLDV